MRIRIARFMRRTADRVAPQPTIRVSLDGEAITREYLEKMARAMRSQR